MERHEWSRREFIEMVTAGGLAAALTGAGCSFSREASDPAEPLMVDSPVGKHEIDTTGSPVGVARMDVSKSYAGIGELLQEHIDHADPDAWKQIKAKIDYTYEILDLALAPLEAETGFGRELHARIRKGQKLFFKPNLVGVAGIDPQTHGPAPGSTANTEWPFVAALMRWFHDQQNISYHQMALGEAATCMPAVAGQYSLMNPAGRTVTTEATIEGRTGDFYGGWGFYFVRKYLAEALEPGRSDDPMRGYEQSVAGTYIPPGFVADKLMVYDLNRIFDDPTKGRNVEVPDGINYKSIILHKVVVGGAPDDPQDRKAYPGCILVNVPRLKVHAISLFTNVIKNLGIGLYPMQVATHGNHRWDYSTPHNAVPGIKSGIPHQVWVPEMDLRTGTPKRNDTGSYVVKKTGGLTATMIDVIKATSNQDIFMLHVVDAIQPVNLNHMGSGRKESEGMVFAGLDPVATDLLCARYMFSNVPFEEAMKVELDDGTGGLFPQRVPIPGVEGKQIITRPGYDCPLSRDMSFKRAEERGLGVRKYYVVGWDAVTDRPLVSILGHLGSVSEGTFSDLVTENLYFNTVKMPWDLQRTAFNYLGSIDRLTGSSLRKDFLAALDEDGDGVITYEEFGKKGIWGPPLAMLGRSISTMGTDRFGYLRGPFQASATQLKWSSAEWNPEGHDVTREFFLWAACTLAYQMSQMDTEALDPFLTGLTWGKGKWPSYQLAFSTLLGISLYGSGYPQKIGFPSLYGSAFRYADLTQNEGRYAGRISSQPDPEAINNYVARVLTGDDKPLDFKLYVPTGYANMADTNIPNVEVTMDPARVFTAAFVGGELIW
jgi:hypothetical protein